MTRHVVSIVTDRGPVITPLLPLLGEGNEHRTWLPVSKRSTTVISERYIFVCDIQTTTLIIYNMQHLRHNYLSKGVGEGGQGGGHEPPTFKSGGGGTSGFVPPTFGQSKCSNFTICSYFVVKNTFFFFKILARFARQL